MHLSHFNKAPLVGGACAASCALWHLQCVRGLPLAAPLSAEAGGAAPSVLHRDGLVPAVAEAPAAPHALAERIGAANVELRRKTKLQQNILQCPTVPLTEAIKMR